MRNAENEPIAGNIYPLTPYVREDLMIRLGLAPPKDDSGKKYGLPTIELPTLTPATIELQKIKTHWSWAPNEQCHGVHLEKRLKEIELGGFNTPLIALQHNRRLFNDRWWGRNRTLWQAAKVLGMEEVPIIWTDAVGHLVFRNMLEWALHNLDEAQKGWNIDSLQAELVRLRDQRYIEIMHINRRPDPYSALD